MRRRNSFRPTVADTLEPRVTLSRVGVAAPAALLGGLAPRTRTFGRTPEQPIVAQINGSFDQFVQDYTRARAAYLSTLGAATADTSASDAFRNYTRYRVELLGQQLTGAFAQGAAQTRGKLKGTSGVPSLAGLVSRRINALETTINATSRAVEVTDNVFRVGTLGRALLDATPAAGTSPAAATLNSLAQDQAIEAARESTLNGLNSAKFALAGGKRGS